MWNGPRAGPRGGMPFRGEMFEGRNGPTPGFRGEGMNMGAGATDRPLMEMRRFDYLPDMGRNMGPDRGRDRDFFRPGDEPDISFRRRFDMGQNVPDCFGQGRAPTGMGGREMQNRNVRGRGDQFMDMRDMNRCRTNFPGFDISLMERRQIAMESIDRTGNRRERDAPQMGMNDLDGFSMDRPPRERAMTDFERRRSGPPLNPRGRFDTDMDFRNRVGSSGDFRDRSPQRFRRDDGNPSNVRARPDMPPDWQGPEKANHKIGELTLRDREFPEEVQNLPGFRGEDGVSLTEQWGRCGNQERGSLPRDMTSRFQSGPGKEGDLGESTQFKERGLQSMEVQGKDHNKKISPVKKWDNIPADFPGKNVPHAIQKLPLLPMDPALAIQSRGTEGQPWPRDGGKASQGLLKGKDILHDEVSKKGNLMSEPRGERQDQDYRDIDYRTSSGPKYDYILEDLQVPEKNLKEPKLATERSNTSGSQDQDYRSAGVQDKISHTIAISEIPKTATMQQILDAFAVRDGVPMQGMKIRDVVPGYSSDTAYVEFLNIEDAVHFMESNQGSVKVGSSTALLKYIQPGRNAKGQQQDPPLKATPATQDGLLPCPILPKLKSEKEEGSTNPPGDPHTQGMWQRSSSLTPEAWQQQVDKQQQQDTEEWGNQKGSRPLAQHSDPIFKESKTMIIKNLLPTTTLETILKALDPFVYLEERNVRLVKGKTPGAKCFCFVDMDTHKDVVRLVELLTIPRPITIDGVRVFAEIAKPLKNQNYRKDQDKANTSLLGFPPDVKEQKQFFPQTSQTAIGMSAAMQGMCASADLMHAVGSESSLPSATVQSSSSIQVGAFPEAPATGFAGSENPELSGFLYDATSGFYYDPQTTLYYDPTSRYFYNAQTQKYLYWDSTTKAYVPVEGSNAEAQENTPAVIVAEAIPAEEVQAPLEAAPEQKENEEATQRSEKKEKEEKPKSLAAFKIMKDMERWAKIQNRQKETVRAPSPVLKRGGEDKKVSKAADAAFAIFERKGAGGDDLFKKPFAPPKKEEKAPKRPIGSLGMLAADYAAGSDDEEEEKLEKIETPPPTVKSQPQTDEKEDRLTDWKKMACLLCRRQFPSKDSLIRHQQLSDLHKQNMEIHLKIKKSKKELEALENQEREMKTSGISSPPDTKRRKQQDEFGSSSRDGHKANERPGLGSDNPERKKDSGAWNYATYQQAVRKAMFARFKELD